MSFISHFSDLVLSVEEVDIDSLYPHEKVVDSRLFSFINYLKSLEGELFVSSLIVCYKTNVLIDGHHRYHAFKYFGINKVPVTYIDYENLIVRPYFDNRISKEEIISKALCNNLLPPKSSKHVIYDEASYKYHSVLLLSSIWSFNI
jgi:hypothetical protein